MVTCTYADTAPTFLRYSAVLLPHASLLAYLDSTSFVHRMKLEHYDLHMLTSFSKPYRVHEPRSHAIDGIDKHLQG